MDRANSRHAVPRMPQDSRGLPGIRFARGQYSRWEFERDGEEVLIAADGRLSLNDQGLMVDAALAGEGLAYVFEAQAWSSGD
ncbi:hypothetical protein [Myxococcus sp. CA039A]|uniref:hypothetical protein n=1 Tax=Myxococcus sp. CA039A TaxID=2741737 RepID=UPI00157AE102|nr:hypothetical protein [Myxococcus sp. CA039A]NTX56214.1 hypothetical protein [Myxococcus sp. CA039A]